MIETTIVCTCDKCKKTIIPVEGMFRISRTDVPLSSRTNATNYPLAHDGVFINYYDSYKAYHVCVSCSEELIAFLEGKT
jgi:hypothetical protein